MSELGDWTAVSTVGDILARGAFLHPERDAVVFPEQRFTYGDLQGRAVNVARALLALGVHPGEHVGLLAANGIEFIEGFFGASLIGAVVVPLNARLKGEELGYIIENADLVTLLTTSGADDYVDFTEVLHEALPSLKAAGNTAKLSLSEAPRLRAAALLRGEEKAGFIGRDQFDRIAGAVSVDAVDQMRRRVRVRGTAAILYTSGTTAKPKGCMLSHEAMTRGPVFRASERLVTDGRHISWAGGPLFHIAALAPMIGALGAGGTYLTDVYFEPGQALMLMKREQATTAWPWFPAPMQALMDHPAFDPQELDSLRYLFLIGPQVLLERTQALLPKAEFVAACGMTETAGIYAMSLPDESMDERIRAQGKPVPGIEVRIVDPVTQEQLPLGAMGETLVRGYCVTDGYYRDTEKTASTIDAEGWLHTGDLYSKDESGGLVFHGRLKDMLKVGGENVAAIEIEAFLAAHPAVRTVEVVGAPDDRLDEVPVAFVELEEGVCLEAEELIEYCRGRIARYKVPRAVYFMKPEDWPMSATKISKKSLRQRLQPQQNVVFTG